MENFGSTISKHLLVERRLQAFNGKCLKKLAVCGVSASTQYFKVSVIRTQALTSSTLSDVVFNRRMCLGLNVQVLIASLKQMTCCVSNIGVGA